MELVWTTVEREGLREELWTVRRVEVEDRLALELGRRAELERELELRGLCRNSFPGSASKPTAVVSNSESRSESSRSAA